MTEKGIIAAIKGGIFRLISGITDPNAEVVAKGLLEKAITKIGRMPGVDWNRDAVTFSLISGQSVYKCGVDILTDFNKVKNLQFLWRTDTRDSPIKIVTLQEFNAYARGSTGTGRPELATLHSSDETLEIWRTPDSAYTVWGYAQKIINNLEQVPEFYHDVLIDYAIASLDPRNAMMLAQLGIKEMRDDSLTVWDGNSFTVGRPIGGEYTGARADSYNLRGD